MPITIFDTQNDVAIAKIVKVVGEGENREQHAFQVPSGFIFDARGFNRALLYKIIDIDRKFISSSTVVLGKLS